LLNWGRFQVGGIYTGYEGVDFHRFSRLTSATRIALIGMWGGTRLGYRPTANLFSPKYRHSGVHLAGIQKRKSNPIKQLTHGLLNELDSGLQPPE